MGTSATIVLAPTLASSTVHAVPLVGPPMDVVSVFGFLTAFFTLVAALHHRQARAFVLMLAIGLAGLSVYGFLQGAWPVGFVNGYFSVAIFSRWRRSRKIFIPIPSARALRPLVSPARMSRMFGSN
jgi:hypothetical protein